MNSSDKIISEQQVLAEASEQQVISALLNGVNDESFRLLVLKYKVMLLNMARTMVGEAEAEDVLQEALYSAYIALTGFSQERIGTLKLKSWLYRITINRAKKNLMNVAKKPPLFSMQSEAFNVEFFDRLEVSAHERPETALAALEIRELVADAISALPKKYQDTASLYFVEGYSLADIAEEFNQSVNIVKTHIHRSRVQLKVALKTLVD